MFATIVTAILGALGIAGTLAAARIQARAASRQAEAALAQAHATHRAALDAAATQAQSDFARQAREAQRPIYLAFIDASRAFADGARPLFDGSAQRNDPLATEMRELQVAASRIELEGPTALIDLTHRVLACASQVQRFSRSLRNELAALYRLGAAIGEHDAPVSDADDFDIAHAALNALHRLHTERGGMTGRQRLAHYRGRRHSSLPPAAPQDLADFSSRLSEAETALLAAQGARMLTEAQRNALIFRAVDNRRSAVEMFDSALDQFMHTRGAFTDAARDHLHTYPL
ncbi:hypothetical protein [Streptomyces lavendofoliae]|uniref:hypothetical protein n=1 Tax=Streptomyces lavendofoliae TaxID=67314 RepID=UPI00300EC686